MSTVQKTDEALAELSSKWVDTHVGRESLREGLSEEMTCKLRPEEEWKPGCEELERVF